ncbi:MAG: tRNA (adenosine(37)-N6)-dimethylallyltransferase MiaA [Verrucomicrobia bacterium]|nr:tRNA (adenosine(37)-N6)-dimethylallyltransferase MiaA [Verrucomicrobiota bacterium]MBS0645092.1 tRNA (adenosine(37)-N6)-dimethylallyltransferase MiaA [Verrucomicrobiota bacterium]
MSITPQCKQTTSPVGTFLPLEKKLKEFPRNKAQKVILIAGPTACGKTALSLILAKMLGGEIISTDSMQVYRGMDIGTAKVSKEAQEQIPHHLIDIRHIHENFNVVDFYYEAKQCCESILARDRVPILVGGTGFYFRAFVYGPPGGPPSVPEIRQHLEQEMDCLGKEALYHRLQDLDPSYAISITQNDKHKVIRALEIMTLTGKKVSDIEWGCHKSLSDYDYHCWFIYRPRQILYQAIEHRCEQMLEMGLIEEVKQLEKLGLRHNTSASQAIGYRQCLEFLDGKQDIQAYQRLVQQFKAASRQYAKRQFTWFRKESLFRWLNVDVHDLEIAADMIMQEYYAT